MNDDRRVAEIQKFLKNSDDAFMAILKAVPMLVTDANVYGNNACWVCPNCKNTFEREYQSYCDRCGQKLKWQSLERITYHAKSEI